MTAGDPRVKAPVPDPMSPRVQFYARMCGALASFALFVGAVVSIGLSGARDERGFWPVLMAALGLGLLLAGHRTASCDTVIAGCRSRSS